MLHEQQQPSKQAPVDSSVTWGRLEEFIPISARLFIFVLVANCLHRNLAAAMHSALALPAQWNLSLSAPNQLIHQQLIMLLQVSAFQ
jgi:hypothetical protein